MSYLIHNATLALIYVIVALSYAIPVGYGGMLNLGHIGLLGVGAYTAAVLAVRGLPFFVTLLAAAAITGMVGFLLALPARRIRGDYYALMTLGFTFVANAVFLNWMRVTEGPFGITGIPRPGGFASPPLFLLLVAIMALVTFLFVRRIVRSRFGKALEAVRDDHTVAESLGKPTGKLRIISLFASAVLVGIAGALLAYFMQFINPQIFWFDNVVWILAALVIGGLASLRGAVAGMLALFALFEVIRFLPIPPALVGSLRLALFAFTLLFVVLVKPKGFFGRAQLE